MPNFSTARTLTLTLTFRRSLRFLVLQPLFCLVGPPANLVGFIVVLVSRFIAIEESVSNHSIVSIGFLLVLITEELVFDVFT